MTEEVERRVVEEVSEDLRTVRLDRKTREEKSAIEREAYGEEPEVEFFEDSFARRTPESADDVRRAVDGLAFVPRPLASYRKPEPAPVVAPVRAAPKEPPLTSEERAAVERAFGSGLRSTRLVSRTSRSAAVEVRLVRDGHEEAEIVIVKDGEVVSVREATKHADAFEPKRPAPPPTSSAKEASPLTEKASRFKLPFGKKKEESAAAPAEPSPAPEPAKESRFRLPFGKKKKDE